MVVLHRCCKECIWNKFVRHSRMYVTNSQELLHWILGQKDDLRTKSVVADTETWQQDDGQNKASGGRLDDRYVSKYTCNYTLSSQDVSKETRLLNPFHFNRQSLRFVAGLDVSFLRNGHWGCVALVICQLPNLEVVYEDLQMVEIEIPREDDNRRLREVPAFVHVIKRLETLHPYMMPQVLLIDGHGLSSDNIGPATVVGILTDMPTIGITKQPWGKNCNLSLMSQFIVRDDGTINLVAESLTDSPDHIVMVKTHKASKPLFISVGHKVTINRAFDVVKRCLKYRIPEPVRQADKRSREFLQKKFPRLAY